MITLTSKSLYPNEYIMIIEMKLELYYVRTPNKPTMFRTTKNKVESVGIISSIILFYRTQLQVIF